MVFALGFGVANSVGVVPHARQVGDGPAEPAHLFVQRPVGVVVRAHQQLLRRRPKSRGRPFAADQLEVAADPAGGDHDGLGGTDLVLVALLGAFGDDTRADDSSFLGDEPSDPRAQPQVERGVTRMGLDRAPNSLHQRLAGSPCQMEAGHRVAVAEVAALGPVDDGKELHAELAQPAANIVARSRHVLLGPAPGPGVLGVELGDPQPILQRQRLGIGNARAALLGRVDHEHAAERLTGKSADLLRLTAVEQQHRVAASQQLKRADQAGEASPDDDHIGRVFGHGLCLVMGLCWWWVVWGHVQVAPPVVVSGCNHLVPNDLLLIQKIPINPCRSFSLCTWSTA